MSPLPEPIRALLASLGRIALGIGLGVPLVLFPYLYLIQDELIFPAPHYHPAVLQAIQRVFGPEAELTLTTGDGVELRGWHLTPARRALVARRQVGGAGVGAEPGGGGDGPLLLYFGGNGELAGDFLWEAERLPPGWGVAALDYRGYGRSGGAPGERELVADGLALYDHLAGVGGVDPERMVVMGRSLGSGVAVAVAASRPVAGVVLVTPFDSMVNVARELYPYAPVGWLLRHPFDSVGRAPGITVPLLVLAAESDTLIPPHHARALVEAWGGPRELHLVGGTDHNTIQEGEGYWDRMVAFLRQRGGERNPSGPGPLPPRGTLGKED